MPEIKVGLGIVEGICEIPYPAQCIGIYIYCIVPDERRTVFYRCYVSVAVDDLSDVFPGVICIIVNIFGFRCLLVVDPEIGIIKLSDIDLFFCR